MRLIACLYVFGVPPESSAAVKERILEVVKVSYQHPALTAWVDMLLGILDCVLGLRPLTCLSSVGNYLWAVSKDLAGIVGDAFAAFGSLTGWWASGDVVQDTSVVRTACPAASVDPMVLSHSSHPFQGLNMLLKRATNGWLFIRDADQEQIQQLEIASLVVPVYREMRYFYNVTLVTMGMSLALWVFRHIPVTVCIQQLERQTVWPGGQALAVRLKQVTNRSPPTVRSACGVPPERHDPEHAGSGDRTGTHRRGCCQETPCRGT